MSEELFILAGNGPYPNRGCEAIVRGTQKIIGESFERPRFAALSMLKDGQLEAQREKDGNTIAHYAGRTISRRFDALWFAKRLRRVSPSIFERCAYGDILPHLAHAKAVLSVGGDNYSLDYGRPDAITALDNMVLRHNKPLIIWGASVGPFDRLPSYERFMARHLNKVSSIFVRESATRDYLSSIGVKDNVHLVADPAFLMDPCPPVQAGFSLDQDAIGLNLSPLMGNYACGGNRDLWLRTAAKIITAIANRIPKRLYLVSHVTAPHDDDFAFLREAYALADADRDQVVLLPPFFDAAETKWIISRMACFAGARTHSTIAALSSAVPTLSFAYSMKAKGINRDIFGHEGYLLNTRELVPELIAEKMADMLEHSEEIHQEISRSLPAMKAAALSAGGKLKEILE